MVTTMLKRNAKNAQSANILAVGPHLALNVQWVKLIPMQTQRQLAYFAILVHTLPATQPTVQPVQPARLIQTPMHRLSAMCAQLVHTQLPAAQHVTNVSLANLTLIAMQRPHAPNVTQVSTHLLEQLSVKAAELDLQILIKTLLLSVPSVLLALLQLRMQPYVVHVLLEKQTTIGTQQLRV